MNIVNRNTESKIPESRKFAFSLIAIFILIFSVYSNTFHVPWHFDDINNILENRALHLTDFSAEKITNTFYAGPLGRSRVYRPVACFSFALNYYFGKTNVFGYHLVNISLHFLTAVFLFLFLNRVYSRCASAFFCFRFKSGPRSDLSFLFTVAKKSFVLI